MSKSVNKVILIGHVGNDPEVKDLSSGSVVANLSLATSENWKDKDTGERSEKTEWHRVVCFNKLAEVIEKYVKKGDLIYIEGQIQTRSWEQDGVKRYSTEIIGKQMQMLGSPRQDNDGQQRQGSGGQPQERYQRQQPEREQGRQRQAPPADDFKDDDIPF